MFDAQELAANYVAIWNESDPEQRRQRIAALWLPDGQHYVDVREAHGHAAREQRIIGSHNKNVGGLGYCFRAAKDARALLDVVTFHWDVPTGTC